MIDNLILARLLFLFNQKIENTEAFKRGLINQDGKVLKKRNEMSSDEKSVFTMLHHVIMKLKRLLATVPGGESQLATIVASGLAMKEEIGGTAIGCMPVVPVVSKKMYKRKLAKQHNQ
jgi:hypothetical protein